MEAKADAVMGKIHTLLSDKAVNPFKFRRIQSRVLSGEEEGAFAWLAVNYLNNVFPVDGTYGGRRGDVTTFILCIHNSNSKHI